MVGQTTVVGRLRRFWDRPISDTGEALVSDVQKAVKLKLRICHSTPKGERVALLHRCMKVAKGQLADLASTLALTSLLHNTGLQKYKKNLRGG
ncbi:protein of unknown function [Paraburkholderia dioscoreae]|uniref:Uncharacterized protein n=1 Tax=Paraburkholderia dioscoreae TaxID=2604047 RepID=A0A5Q4YUQ3_9BURK|nr:protein of unknown function [Paraburkholderia dioscoreae]